jgi:hypothetical protein
MKLMSLFSYKQFCENAEQSCHKSTAADRYQSHRPVVQGESIEQIENSMENKHAQKSVCKILAKPHRPYAGHKVVIGIVRGKSP